MPVFMENRSKKSRSKLDKGVSSNDWIVTRNSALSASQKQSKFSKTGSSQENTIPPLFAETRVQVLKMFESDEKAEISQSTPARVIQLIICHKFFLNCFCFATFILQHKCEICSKDYAQRSGLAHHQKMKHSPETKKFQCLGIVNNKEVCGKICMTKYNAQVHFRRAHETDPDEDDIAEIMIPN